MCRKYNIDISDRKIHGALKDAKLLSLVYLELIGGKQIKLGFNNKLGEANKNEYCETFAIMEFYNKKEVLPKKRVTINSHDNKLHLESLKQIPKCIWESLKN